MKTTLKSLAKKYRRLVVITALVLLVAVFSLNYWVVRSTRTAVHHELASLPENHVALVLGTGKRLKSGRENPHFRVRVEAAAALYHAGKVSQLLLSGDNHIAGYDEPTHMKESLLALGVPESALTLDYAGFRTLDSVVRARKVFGQTRITIVTDDFHAARSVFLARHCGVEADAFCSERVSPKFSSRSRVREVGARVKAVLDLYVFHTGPHFLGEPVTIAARD